MGAGFACGFVLDKTILSFEKEVSSMPSVGEEKASDVSETRKCAGCEKPASSLQCPKCLQLNVLDSYFCDQDCFKRNWVDIS